ncbi:MAG: hypothetical protein ACOC4M_18090 [Promethearchaeia archaeon]
MPYQTIVTITSWWTDAGLLQKTAPEELKLGGPKYFFELTEVGETYLRQLYTDLHVFYGGEVEKSEPSETDEVALPPEVINSLMLNIPEYLTDLGISFTQEQYKRFTEKVKTFLEKEGVNIETYFD